MKSLVATHPWHTTGSDLAMDPRFGKPEEMAVAGTELSYHIIIIHNPFVIRLQNHTKLYITLHSFKTEHWKFMTFDVIYESYMNHI